MYNKIVNPLTNRKVLVNSRLGQQIINNYMNQLGGSNNLTNDDITNRARKNWSNLRGDVRNNANKYVKRGRARTNARRNWSNLRGDVRDNANRYREMGRNMNGHVGNNNNNNMNDNVG